MLNKNVCKHCVNTIRNGDIVEPWSNGDEGRWSTRGRINCPQGASITPRSAQRNQEPPEWCQYVFEHAVAAGRSEC